MRIEKRFSYTLELTDSLSDAFCAESREGIILYYRIKTKTHSGWEIIFEDNDELFQEIVKADAEDPSNHVGCDYPTRYGKCSKLWDPPMKKLTKLLKLQQFLPFSYQPEKKRVYFNHL